MLGQGPRLHPGIRGRHRRHRREAPGACAPSGIDGYSAAVEHWLDEAPRGIDDEVKKDALKRLFSQSQVALIYGAAGTGKSTMVDHIANYFNDKSKLFLAHTNPAIDNLKRKVTAQDSTFRTISSHIYRTRLRSGVRPPGHRRVQHCQQR